jgi:phosphoribosylaminoimidazole-succinocarboxamide synthase
MFKTMTLPFEALQKRLPAEPLLSPPAMPWPRAASGKVRDIHDAGDYWLIVASDRLSAFDVILPDGIPGKGIILTQLSLWWFERTQGLMQNHLPDGHERLLDDYLGDYPALRHRSMLVRKLKPLPIEAVVRGYLAGSGWKTYQRTGKLFDLTLPPGLRESDALPEPLFTPTSKAQQGHDEPLSHAEGQKLLGEKRFEAVKTASLALFREGQRLAHQAGILLADTKFEFGEDAAGNLFLIDEVLTPDSSRYWPANDYAPGRGQHAYDKQFVRDYLETLDWDKTAPGPHLPSAVIRQTHERYLEAYRRLTAL